MDFTGADGWRMYHGHVVPGFPQHPHRGFETVTFVRRGYIDHSDSMGATARFSRGDVQWLTAGGGIVHCEMFPLLDPHGPNPCELFQIWLNLPAADKMVEPYFTMLWNEDIPRHEARDSGGLRTEVTVIAGSLAGLEPPAGPPNSWASRPDADVAIWHIAQEPSATWTLPPAVGADTVRTLYVFEGSVHIGNRHLEASTGAVLRPDVPVEIVGGPHGAEALLLQGRPIDEPVVQYGPFVMNDDAGIEQAMMDYRSTGFGGGAGATHHPVDPREGGGGAPPAHRPPRAARGGGGPAGALVHRGGGGGSARHADGRIERPDERVHSRHGSLSTSTGGSANAERR